MVDERALTHVYVCVRLSDLALFLGVRRVSRVWFQSTANETQNWGKADKTCRSQVVNGSGRNDQLTSIADDPALMRPVCLSARTKPHLLDITCRNSSCLCNMCYRWVVPAVNRPRHVAEWHLSASLHVPAVDNSPKWWEATNVAGLMTA